MTKYYRVRTQEQWDWLVNRFGQSETQWPEQGMSFREIRECLASGGFVIVHNDYFPSVGSVLYTATPQNNGNVIEVSQMMEESRMEDYVEIKGEDLFDLTADGPGVLLSVVKRGGKNYYDLEANSITKIGVPTRIVYPKVPMTETEKKEFDSIREEETLYNALDVIDHYPHLYKRIYEHTSASIPEFELEFARAWADPSLIEVIPDKKWNVKVPFIDDEFYYKNDVGGLYHAPVAHNHENNQQFTAEELKHYGLDNDLFEKVEVKE